MSLPFLALLLAGAASAQAAPHVLLVRVIEGTQIYSHAMNVQDENQENFVGKPDEAGAERKMVVNAVVARAGTKFGVELQVELVRADKSGSFQLQTSLEMRAGQRLTVVECGDWKVDVALDGKPGRAAPAAWSSEGLDDYRLTTDLAVPATPRRCRQVLRNGSQSDIVESVTMDAHRSGFVHAVLGPFHDGGFGLEYQLKQGALEAKNQTTLVLGRKSTIPVNGGKIDFLLEGTAPAAPDPSADSAGQADGAVPLLR